MLLFLLPEEGPAGKVFSFLPVAGRLGAGDGGGKGGREKRAGAAFVLKL